MNKKSAPQKAAPTPKSPPIIKLSPDKPSKLRGFLALVLAGFALFFATTAILAYWTEKTLTNTDNFMAVVGPLAKDPDIQKLASQKLTEVITDKASQNELAQTLYDSKPPDIGSLEVKNQIDQKIQTEINKVISSEQFSKVWISATSGLHAQLIKILSSPENSTVAVISYQSSLNDLLGLLKTTQLKQLSAADLEKGSGEIQIKSQDIKAARQYYQKLINVDTAVIILALVFGGLAVLVANFRMKMVRKLAFGLVVITGLTILMIQLSTSVTISGADATELRAGQAILSSLLSELVRLSIIICALGLGLIGIATLIIHRRPKTQK